MKRQINIKFPLEDDKVNNFLFQTNSVTKDALRSNLLLLLLTDKGQRYYLPEYGTNLRKFIFEQKDQITQNDIESDIVETVNKFIPQLTIRNVQFFGDQDEDGNLIKENEIQVAIDFEYAEDVFSEPDQLVITI